MKNKNHALLANRDPSGYVFFDDGKYKRKVAPTFESIFESVYKKIIKSGLVSNKILPIVHVSRNKDTTIEPIQLDFSYLSYEMPFSLLKEMALFHLDLCENLLEYNFILKDARPDNYQLFEGKVVLIDHLSIIPYTQGSPLFFYKEFIEKFIGPMILFSSGLKSNFPLSEEVSLPNIKKIATCREKLNIHFFINIIMHSKFYHHSNSCSNVKINKKKIFGIIQSLKSLSKCIHLTENSLWKDYSDDSEYQNKKIMVAKNILDQYGYKRILNLGSNLSIKLWGHTLKGLTLHLERDPQVASRLHKLLMGNYKNQFSVNMNIIDVFKRTGHLNTGLSLLERFQPDCVLLLSIIHHIYDQTSFSVDHIMQQLSTINADLVIEYVSIDELVHFSSDLIPRHSYPEINEFKNILRKYYGSIETKGTLSPHREIFLAKKS